MSAVKSQSEDFACWEGKILLRLFLFLPTLLAIAMFVIALAMDRSPAP